IPWRHSSLGNARALLHLEGGPAYADASLCESLGSGSDRQLRSSGHDRSGRIRKGKRDAAAFRRKDSHETKRHSSGCCPGSFLLRYLPRFHYGTDTLGGRRAYTRLDTKVVTPKIPFA